MENQIEMTAASNTNTQTQMQQNHLLMQQQTHQYQHQQLLMQPKCAICKTTDRLMRCGKCKCAFYCSTLHQTMDWPSHKKNCRLLAKQRTESNTKMQQLQQAVSATTLKGGSNATITGQVNADAYIAPLQNPIFQNNYEVDTSANDNSSAQTDDGDLGVKDGSEILDELLAEFTANIYPNMISNYEYALAGDTQLSPPDSQVSASSSDNVTSSSSNQTMSVILDSNVKSSEYSNYPDPMQFNGQNNGFYSNANTTNFPTANVTAGDSSPAAAAATITATNVEMQQFLITKLSNENGSFVNGDSFSSTEEASGFENLNNAHAKLDNHCSKMETSNLNDFNNRETMNSQLEGHPNSHQQSMQSSDLLRHGQQQEQQEPMQHQNPLNFMQLDQEQREQQQQRQQQHKINQYEKSSSYRIGQISENVIGNVNERRYEDLCRNIISDMNQYGLSVVDDFLGMEKGLQILSEVHRMYSMGNFQDGQLMSSIKSEQDLRTIRGDKIMWVKGTECGCANIGYLINQIDAVVCRANTMKNNGKLGDYNIKERTKAMAACYPGSGSHYVMHVDNPNKDGRVITAIYYLNLNWDTKRSGGMLRVFPEHGNTVADIEPKFDRLIFFWSDKRNPHEVQPAHRTRYAVTVWYFDADEREAALNRARYNAVTKAPSTKATGMAGNKTTTNTSTSSASAAAAAAVATSRLTTINRQLQMQADSEECVDRTQISNCTGSIKCGNINSRSSSCSNNNNKSNDSNNNISISSNNKRPMNSINNIIKLHNHNHHHHQHQQQQQQKHQLQLQHHRRQLHLDNSKFKHNDKCNRAVSLSPTTNGIKRPATVCLATSKDQQQLNIKKLTKPINGLDSQTNASKICT